MTRPGFRTSPAGVFVTPVFIDCVADFVEADNFARQFHDLNRGERLHRIGRRITQWLEQSGAHQHRDVVFSQPQHCGGLCHIQHGWQAERNARWLSNHLTKKTGENVSIQALIVLPGWFVEQGKGNFNVKVMNAAYLAGFLRRQDENLDPAQVRRLITALDEKCRTLEF